MPFQIFVVLFFKMPFNFPAADFRLEIILSNILSLTKTNSKIMLIMCN